MSIFLKESTPIIYYINVYNILKVLVLRQHKKPSRSTDTHIHSRPYIIPTLLSLSPAHPLSLLLAGLFPLSLRPKISPLLLLVTHPLFSLLGGAPPWRRARGSDSPLPPPPLPQASPTVDLTMAAFLATDPAATTSLAVDPATMASPAADSAVVVAAPAGGSGRW